MVVEKTDYLDKMGKLLNDTWEFEKIFLENDVILSFTFNQEKQADNIFEKLVASNSIQDPWNQPRLAQV